jgi:probable phosphoglycerate mutase
MLIDLIRHGRPAGGSRYRGHGIDDPLSEEGWRQMWNAVGDAAPWDHVVSSPLQRCRAFAEALAERHGLPLTVEPRFREVGFGDWEGRTREELRRERPQEYAAFYRDPVGHRPPGAEPLAAFTGRVTEAYEGTVVELGVRHCLVVAHAGVIRALVARVLGLDGAGMYRLRVDNAGITRIRHEAGQPLLLVHNAERLPART